MTLHCLGLHAEAGFLLVFQHSLHQFTHNCPLFSLNFIDINLKLLILLAHLVEGHPKVVTFFIELGLLAEVELLSELSLILALA